MHEKTHHSWDDVPEKNTETSPTSTGYQQQNRALVCFPFVPASLVKHPTGFEDGVGAPACCHLAFASTSHIIITLDAAVKSRPGLMLFLERTDKSLIHRRTPIQFCGLIFFIILVCVWKKTVLILQPHKYTLHVLQAASRGYIIHPFIFFFALFLPWAVLSVGDTWRVQARKQPLLLTLKIEVVEALHISAERRGRGGAVQKQIVVLSAC